MSVNLQLFCKRNIGMIKLFVRVAALFLVFLSVNAQTKNDKPFIVIDSEDTITKNEFIRIYLKNNNVKEYDDKNLNDYLKLFTEFRLKVKEAKDLGYDTASNFKKELNIYVKQLATPYLIDSTKLNELLKEAHERMKTDVRVKQIMVLIPKNPTPEDTLKAFNKIWQAYKELKKGKKFEDIAKKYSENKFSASKGGDMGWFNVFRYPYKFETMAYTLPENKFSKPFRTPNAYHIVMVTDKRPNKGRVQVAHILFSVSLYADKDEIAKAKAKADSVYKLLLNGADFAELAKKLSDDRSSAYKGGLLNWFGTGDMVEPFEKAAFSIEKIGDITKPVRTPIGFHIMKLINIDPVKSYKEMESKLLTQIKKNDRYKLAKLAKINQLKKEYNFSYNKKALAEFYEAVGDSLIFGKANTQELKKLNKTLFSLDNKNFSQQEFANYLIKKYNKKATNKTNKKNSKAYNKFTIDKDFKEFINDFIQKYEIKKLPQKDENFKFVLKEYHDGILLFNLMNDKVWHKAIKDTNGLKEFYEKNKNNYLYPERYKIAKFNVSNEKAKKMLIKLLKKQSKTEYTPEEIADKVNSKYKNSVKIELQKILPFGENSEIDKAIAKANNKFPFIYNDNTNIIFIQKKLEPSPKPLSEVRGLVVSDYQNYLERVWVAELKKKHKVKINQNVLEEIKQQLNTK